MCSCKNWKHGWSLSCNLAVNRISWEKFLFKITLFQLAVLLQKARNKNIEKQHFFIQQNCSLKLKYFKPICLKLKQIPKQFFKEKNLQFFISFSPGSTLNFRNKLPHLLHYKTSYKYKQLKTKSETDLKFTACKYKTKNSFRTTCEVSRLIYISQTISNAKKIFVSSEKDSAKSCWLTHIFKLASIKDEIVSTTLFSNIHFYSLSVAFKSLIAIAISSYQFMCVFFP